MKPPSALLITRTRGQVQLQPIAVQSVPEAAFILERARGHQEVLGIYLQTLNVAVTPCGCENGCPLCEGTTFRVWNGPGPLAPHLPIPRNAASQ